MMLFLFIIPVFAGIANYVIPLMIGAPDMAFPRLNALTFWTLLFGGVMLLCSSFARSAPSPPAGPTTRHSRARRRSGSSSSRSACSSSVASSITTAINFLVTIVAMRAPGMTIWRMPLLVWANFTTSLLVVFATPFIAGSQLMVLFDR